MTSRERVKRAVLFQKPDRIPYDLPEKWGTDFTNVGIDADPDWKPSVKTECCWEDEWGCVWEKLPGDKTMGQVKVHPLADYANIKDYRFPNYQKLEQYAAARKTVAKNKEEKFILAGIPLSFIHRLEYLRGHEAAWTDPYLYPDQLEKLLDRFADIAIDAGLNVIQMDQQENMGVEKLSDLFGGKICFWCPVDIQNTMVRGTVSDVRKYAQKLMDSFGRFNGGFIGKWYPSPAAVNHSPEKIDAMSEVFTTYDSRKSR